MLSLPVLLLSLPVATVGYRADYAYTFYKLASAAYCDVDGWHCAPCLASNQSLQSILLLYNQTTDTRTFIASYKDHFTGDDSIVVSFRGTETLVNWIENLKFAKTDREMSCPGCKVHSGFLDSWTPVEHRVVEEVRRLQGIYSDARLYIAGHSLGGALAMLAAYVLEYDHGMSIDGVYTFGAPRVGNQAFAEFYNSKSATHVTWRVTHHRDPVPHLPLKLMGFDHAATEVFYDKYSTSYRVCNGSGEDPACIDSEIGDSISDHLHYFGEPTGETAC